MNLTEANIKQSLMHRINQTNPSLPQKTKDQIVQNVIAKQVVVRSTPNPAAGTGAVIERAGKTNLFEAVASVWRPRHESAVIERATAINY